MQLINAILADVKDIDTCKQIRAFDLKELGYVISKKKLRITNTGYEVREILDEDTMRPVSFAFLFSRKQLTGVILPKEYHRYAIIASDELKGTTYDKENGEGKDKRSPKRPKDT